MKETKMKGGNTYENMKWISNTLTPSDTTVKIIYMLSSFFVLFLWFVSMGYFMTSVNSNDYSAPKNPYINS